MSKDYSSWSVADLKSEYRKLNAEMTEKKAVLKQKIKDYEKRFGPLSADLEPVHKIALPVPPPQDVNSSSPMPSLNSEEMEMSTGVKLAAKPGGQYNPTK